MFKCFLWKFKCVFRSPQKYWATKWQSRQPVAIFAMTFLLLPHGLKKQPTFSWRSHWFSSKMTSAEWAQKSHNEWWRATTHIWLLLLIGWSKFTTTQKHDPDLRGNTLPVSNFCASFSDVISQANQLCRRQMSTVFSGYYPFRNKVHAYHESTAKRNVFRGLKSQTWLSTHCPL